MKLILDVILASIALIALIAALCAAKEILFTPIRRWPDTDIFAVIRAKGDAAGLEQTVNGLMWMRSSGRADMGIIIVADELTEEARRKTEILAEKCGGVVCSPENLVQMTEEMRWTKANT